MVLPWVNEIDWQTGQIWFKADPVYLFLGKTIYTKLRSEQRFFRIIDLNKCLSGKPLIFSFLYESLGKLLRSFKLCCRLSLAVDMSGRPKAVIQITLRFFRCLVPFEQNQCQCISTWKKLFEFVNDFYELKYLRVLFNAKNSLVGGQIAGEWCDIASKIGD